MQYKIDGAPFPYVTFSLDGGESIECQKGAMSWMTPNMKMETKAGGMGQLLSRAVSGEALFKNKYTAEGGAGEISLAASVPGNIIAMEVQPGKAVVAQKSAYLASTLGINVSVFFQKKLGAGFFGGEGFIMQKYEGTGTVFIEVDGTAVEYELAAGQSLIIDTGYLVAMDSSCSMDIQSTGGIGNALFGGEGLFNTKVTGPGKIWLQSMPLTSLAGSLQPLLASKN